METTADRQKVTCSKCNHRNTGDQDTCAKCGAGLYVRCLQCGQRNPRAAARCEKCDSRLRRSTGRRWSGLLKKTPFRKVKFWHLFLLVVGVVAAYEVIVRLAQIE